MHIHKISAFTENGAGGNPAGVVLADMLPDAQIMQRIAREVGYSETVFAAPVLDKWQTRFFSPESEVPFCGHATIALGAVLGSEKGEGKYQLSLANGEIDVETHLNDGVYLSTLRSLPTSNEAASDEMVSMALSIFGYVQADLDQGLLPYRMNAGAEHLLIALKDRKTLSAMSYDLDDGRKYMRQYGLVTVAFIFRETDRLIHARNAFASGGVLEDPATGAAAAALCVMLRDQSILPSGELIILQGADMGRPCRIKVNFDDVSGNPVFVSGVSSKIV